MTRRRPLRPDEMDMNLHYVPRPLIQRAKARASILGLTLKDWLLGLIRKELSKFDPRRDMLPPGDHHDE